MSELIQNSNNRNAIRWKLLTSVSALVLAAHVMALDTANADDVDHPTVWIELGGQMEQAHGTTSAFTAPFMALSPTPDIYNQISFDGSQREARFSFGEEGKVTFQPEGSSWSLTAGIRYGRANSTRHKHAQADAEPVLFTTHYTAFGYRGSYPPKLIYPTTKVLADAQTKNTEQHLIVDFTAGKDVGLGLFGRQGSSTVNAGIRFASFESKSTAMLSGRPTIGVQSHYKYTGYGFVRFVSGAPTFHRYTLSAHAERSFQGVGPTVSWNASAALVGDDEEGKVTFDWGVNAALLFGRQKAKTEHTTQGYHFTVNSAYAQTYSHPHHSTRSRSVTVPNIGGFAGMSLQWPIGKISVGYRADAFFNAMDTGSDTRETKTVAFYGPFATISIGLGG